MADSTLAAVRTKVRRLTRSPSTSQITNAQIDEYVNTFIQYDFPEQLRLFTLKEQFSWGSLPNIDSYATDANSIVVGLRNFNQNHISIHPPVYAGGDEIYFTQDPTEFYRLYPLDNNQEEIGTGDGIATNFQGTLTATPILRSNVTISAINTADAGMILSDSPSLFTISNGNIFDNATSANVGTINYITGAFNITFTAAPRNGETIWAQYRPYTAARPQAMLYYNNIIHLRPIPDKTYRIQFQAYRRPSELLAAGTSPELEQWWQYIAYGAAKKIFEDRTDLESVQMIMPEFKQQERLVLRRTLVQNSNERVGTIYTTQVQGYFDNWWR